MRAFWIVACAACSVSTPEDHDRGAHAVAPPAPVPDPALIVMASETPQPSEPPELLPAADRPAPGPGMGRFQITYYWVADEYDFPGEPDTDLYDSYCFPVATTTAAFARSLSIEGTGVLTDGRLVNFDSHCICNWPPCLQLLGRDRPWGLGVDYRPLVPFRSVAADPVVMPTGTRLYVPELDGLEMPGKPPWGGFVHDGCLVADDRGSAIEGLQIDFFVGWKATWKLLLADYALDHVTVFAAGDRCP